MAQKDIGLDVKTKIVSRRKQSDIRPTLRQQHQSPQGLWLGYIQVVGRQQPDHCTTIHRISQRIEDKLQAALTNKSHGDIYLRGLIDSIQQLGEKRI